MRAKLNSNASIIGSLPSFEVIYEIIHFASLDKSREDIIERFSSTNLFNKRTEESRLRILRAIENSILQFKNEQHKNFIFYTYSLKKFKDNYPFILFLQLLANNELFYLITKNVYLKNYFSGRLFIKNEDVVSYIYFLKEKNKDLQKWTDSTIKTTSSKILTLLKKFGLLEGSQKKEIKHVILSFEQKVILLNFILAVEPETVNILESKFIDFFFIEKSNVINLLKDIKLTQYFDLYFTSDSIKIKSKKEIKGMVHDISY